MHAVLQLHCTLIIKLLVISAKELDPQQGINIHKLQAASELIFDDPMMGEAPLYTHAVFNGFANPAFTRVNMFGIDCSLPAS